MTVNDFVRLVSMMEAKKKQVNIAQLKETVRVINELVDGELYRIIRKSPCKTVPINKK